MSRMYTFPESIILDTTIDGRVNFVDDDFMKLIRPYLDFNPNNFTVIYDGTSYNVSINYHGNDSTVTVHEVMD